MKKYFVIFVCVLLVGCSVKKIPYVKVDEIHKDIKVGVIDVTSRVEGIKEIIETAKDEIKK